MTDADNLARFGGRVVGTGAAGLVWAAALNHAALAQVSRLVLLAGTLLLVVRHPSPIGGDAA